MMRADISWKYVLSCAGTIMAFLMGSGFTTGQEIMQYFTAYGRYGLYGELVVFLLLAYACAFFIRTGQQKRFAKANGIYRHVFGSRLGRVFDMYCTFAVYSSFIIMTAGAGATLHQQFGLSTRTGSMLAGTVAGVCVIFGLRKLTSVLGRLGPVNAVFVILLSAVALTLGRSSPAEGLEAVTRLNLLTASGHWLGAACSYAGICILWLAAFLTAVGKVAKSRSDALLGSLLGTSGFLLALLLLTLAMVTNIECLQGSMVPNLKLARSLSPVLAALFSVIILAGSCTAAMPLLWTTVSRFADEGTTGFRVLTVGLAALGTGCGIMFSFSELVNTVCVFNGYVGISMLPFMLVRDFRSVLFRRRKSASPAGSSPR